MEPSSVPEKPSPEHTFIRPPGFEFSRGLALFSLLFGVFVMLQMVFFIERVYSLTPALHAQGFSWSLLKTKAFMDRRLELGENADIVAWVTTLADLIALALLLLTVRQWKKRSTMDFLAVRLPHWRALLAWVALFIGAFTVLEVLAYFIPGLRSEFMDKMLATMENKGLVLFGLGVMAPLFEEFLLRGLLFRSLRYVMEKHAAVAITAGVFTLMHWQYNWVVLLVYVLPLGVLLGYARANTGSIWTAVLLHMLNNCLSVALPQLP